MLTIRATAASTSSALSLPVLTAPTRDLVRDWYDAQKQARISDPLFPTCPADAPHELGSLYWPVTGASRMAYGAFVIDGYSLGLLRAQLGSTASGFPAVTLAFSDAVNETGTSEVPRTFPLFLLRSYPVARTSTDALVRATGVPDIDDLWVIELVDQRYYWVAATGLDTAGTSLPASWTELFGWLFNKVTALPTATYGTIPSAYLTPGDHWLPASNQSRSVAYMLDEAARMVGSRIVVTPTTVAVQQPSDTNRDTALNWLLAHADDARLSAGGPMYTEDWDDARRAFPKTARTVWPDGSVETVAGAGGATARTVYAHLSLPSSASSGQKTAALTQWIADQYAWQAAPATGTLAGFVLPPASGFVGSVELYHSATTGYTRVAAPASEYDLRALAADDAVTPTATGTGSWVAGLTEDDCLTLTVTSAAGRCADIDTTQTMRLRYDYGTWVSAPDEDFVHDGGSGPVVFSVTATGNPKLTIGGLTGVSAGGTAAYHDFDFGGALLCDAAPASCETNTFRVRLTCLSCPIRPGYNPGPSAAYWAFAMSPGPYTADNGYGGLRGTPLVCNTLADLNKCDVFVYFVNLNGASGTSAGRNWSGASIDVDDLAAWVNAGGRCIVVPYYEMFTGGGGSCGGTLVYVNGVLLCQDFVTAYTRIDAELASLGATVKASLTELTFPTTTFGCGAYWREACSGPCPVAPCGFESVPTAAVVANGAGNVYDPSAYGILTGNYYRSHFLNGTAVTLAPATYYDCPYTGPTATNIAPVMIEQVGSGYILYANYWTFRRNGNGSTCREFYKIARNFRDLTVPL